MRPTPERFDALVRAAAEEFGIQPAEARMIFRLVGHLQDEGIPTAGEAFQAAVDRGWVVTHEEQKAFHITPAGERVAAKPLPEEERS